SYQILGEVPGDTPRCYAVRLKLTDPDAEERARFVVVGIDPLWVFRYEDFQLIAHWDHRMAEEEPAKNEEKSAPEEEPTINNEQQSEKDAPKEAKKTAEREAAESEPVPE
ncbi:MAG TPA: hypothetical protein VHB77_21545, partial [Planctomycetaceae bacterium]|nr:hypothetical protein [Planctomycetaceae bacterium]